MSLFSPKLNLKGYRMFFDKACTIFCNQALCTLRFSRVLYSVVVIFFSVCTSLPHEFYLWLMVSLFLDKDSHFDIPTENNRATLIRFLTWVRYVHAEGYKES